MKQPELKDGWRIPVAIAIPFIAAFLQKLLWAEFDPFIWFLFYPSIFLASWIGGLVGGLSATALSVIIVKLLFVPPLYTFRFEKPNTLNSIVVFSIMGVLFSIVHEQLKKTTNRVGEQRYRRALDEMMEGCQLIDYNWRYVYTNEAAARHGRSSPAHLIGKTMMELYPGVESTPLFKILDRCMTERVSEHFENQFHYPDGTSGWFELGVQPVPEGIFILSIDITSRKQAEQSLEEKEFRYRSLFETMLNGFAYCKMLYVDGKPDDFVYLDVNKAFVSLTGLTGVVGKKVSEVIPGLRESDPTLLETYGRVARTGKPETFENYVEPLRMWFSISVYSPQRDYFVAVFDVITERKKAHATQARLASIVESAADAIITKNLDGTILDWNKGAERLFGYRAEEVNGKNIALLIPPDRRKEEPEIIGRILRGERIEHYESVRIRKDGTPVDVSLTISPIRDERGTVVGASKIARDITERIQAARELQRSEKRLASIFDTVGDIIFMLAAEKDGVFRFVSVNQMFLKTTGLPLEAIVGQRVQDLIPEPSLTMVLNNYGKAIREKGIVRWEETSQYPAGKVTGEVSVAPLFDHDGTCTHLVGAVHDISERKRAEAEIRNLNEVLEQRVLDRTEQLEAANMELEAFAYSVSHDLRAPLRHIDGFIDLLRKNVQPVVENEGLRYLDIISQSAKQMGHLIDDLLAFSRMARQSMTKTEVDCSQLVRDTVAELKIETEGRRIHWKIGTLPNVMADRSMLRLVFVNLIANALKFTRTRTEATIEIAADSGHDGEIVFVVTDNGVGFDMQYSDKLFGVFQRLHRQEDFEGTGIGLANVRRIVHRHGGKTWAEGEPDRGAKFSFSIPKPTIEQTT